MTFDIALLLGLILLALVLFSVDWLSSDVVALGLLLALILTGLLSPQDAFAGFGSDTVLMILGLLIMTTALIRTDRFSRNAKTCGATCVERRQTAPFAARL